MISRFFWNYIFGRARYPIVLGGLSTSVFFANMWFFPTPYLQINGVDQVELSAKPGDEIPVRVAKFDSANGLWQTSGIRAVFPAESEAAIEVDVKTSHRKTKLRASLLTEHWLSPEICRATAEQSG